VSDRVVLGSINISLADDDANGRKFKVQFSSSFWGELAKAPPEVQAETHRLIEAIEEAARTVKDLKPETILGEIERIAGGSLMPGLPDDEDPFTKEEFPSIH
jgi:hypothetical protein